MEKAVCSKCGSDKVLQRVWRNLNTGEISLFENKYTCNECCFGDNSNIITEGEYKKSVEAQEGVNNVETPAGF